MSVLVLGYLGLNLDVSTSPILGIISISLIAIAIVIQCGIAAIAFRQMANKTAVSIKFKLCFVLCFACSCIISSLLIAYIATLMAPDINFLRLAIITHVTIFLQYLFFTILLTILVLRLRVTFDDTELQMSSCTYHMFLAILGFLFVLPFVYTILGISIHALDHGINNTHADHIAELDQYITEFSDSVIILGGILSFIFFVLFITGSAFAVYLFTRNLGKLAEAQAGTPQQCDINASLPSLNRRQQKFTNLAARYMLLFAVATISSLFTLVVSWGFSWKSGIKYVIFAVDMTINLLCVYLQFGFAGQHYRDLCGCLDECCRRRVSMRTRKSIHLYSLGSQSNSASSSSGQSIDTQRSPASCE